MKVLLKGICSSSLSGHCSQMAKRLGKILVIQKGAQRALQKRLFVNENKEALKEIVLFVS